MTQSQIADFMTALQQQGVDALPAGEVELLQLLGSSPTDAVSLLLAADVTVLPDPASLSYLLNTLAAQLGQLADSLR